MDPIIANLVIEEENEPAPPPPLVVGTPIRRRRQITIIAVVALAVIAIIVGVSVGLMLRPKEKIFPPTASPTPAPTASPTPQLEREFKPTLPAYTRERLPNATSPQSLAFDWVMDEDQVPMLEAPSDDQFEVRLERMKERFALATLFFATEGKTAWKDKKGWINATLHECQWFGCCCGTSCDNNYADGSTDDYYYNDGPDDGALRAVRLSFNDLKGSLPRELAF
jgi:hypothetical protein